MSEWARTLVVGAGGFVGATLRYTLGGLVSRAASPEFPWATQVVNVSGCFVIGLLAVLTEERGPVSPSTRPFLMVGVLGGYLVTVEKATVIFYRAGEPPAEP